MKYVYVLQIWGTTIGIFETEEQAHKIALKTKEPTHDDLEGNFIMEYCIVKYTLGKTERPHRKEYEIEWRQDEN